MKWTDKQQQVIDSRNRNLLVSAAAGSGKTAVLVERIIQMISQGAHPLDMDQLLVMTFTNAAAAQMRERIGAGVEQKIRECPENEHLWLQSALIPQAQITTIDSFCLNIIRNHFNSLDIDPSFRMGDEGELSLLKSDVLGEMLEDCYQEARGEFGVFVENFGRGKSDRGIEDVILQAWQFSQSHPWPSEWLHSCRDELGEKSLEEMEQSPWMKFLFRDTACQMEELEAQLEAAILVCGEENGPLAYEPMLLGDREKLRRIRDAAWKGSFGELYQSLQAMSFDRLASIRAKDIDGEKKAFATACRDRVKKAVGKCRDMYGTYGPEEVVESILGTRGAIDQLLELVGRFDEAYRAAKRERNVLDFNDLEHLALEVLYEEVPEEDGGEDAGRLTGPEMEDAGRLAGPDVGGSGTGRPSVRRRPSPVADELSRQYEEILVDEYQDSNNVQEALITSISKERFGHPNVFMVGDVKQSIYRFRLARPELFMEKYGSYTIEEGPYQKIELQQNFRSRESVITSVNDVFYQIMTRNLGGISYTKDTALYPGAEFEEPGAHNLEEPVLTSGEDPRMAPPPMWGGEMQDPGLPVGTPTELLIVDTGAQALKLLEEDALDYTARELEARMIAGRIKELVNGDKGLLIWDKAMGEKGRYRRARPGDMVILLRSMSGWSEVFVNVLMNEGILASAQTSTGYFNTVEVETVLSLLSVVDNPMQDIPLAAVMRSPIIGMNDEEMAWMMAAYKKNSKKGQDRGVYAAWNIWMDDKWKIIDKIPKAAVASIKKKLACLTALLKDLRAEAGYLPIHQLLYHVYTQSGYYDYVSAMPAGEGRRGNLDMLVEKAAAYEATSYKGLFHFVRYIEKLKKYDTDFGEAGVSGRQEHTVRIMSIHKSKGLEFPVVFLAGLGKHFNRQDAYGRILLDADLGAAADYLDLDLRVKAPTLKKQALKRRMELETMGEELRVLYVAMTRAKEKLIMTASDKSLESKRSKWKEAMTVGGQIPYTILSTAGSCLDLVLMALPGVPESHLQVKWVQAGDLIGEEVGRQVLRHMTKDDLLAVDTGHVYDRETGEQLEGAMNYRYPYMDDTGLYAMISVSELKKQSQIGREEDAIGTLGAGAEGEGPGALLGGGYENTGSSGKGALRGTAYHAALEHISFHQIHSLEETGEALSSLVEQGFLAQESRELINEQDIWAFLQSPLGERMAEAEREGRLSREQQFIIGIPAREMGQGSSEELVLVQGIIDAYLEEADGLVLIDYKTDRAPGTTKEQSASMLAERYRLQLEYYDRALTQLTGKKVRERLIYSLALQQSISV